MLLLIICIVYMFLLAANKLLVDTQKNVEELQEIVSRLIGELNEKKTMITQLIEHRKSKIQIHLYLF